MTVPKPTNFTAMANAWDDPIAFARELHDYYAQLEASGHRVPVHDITASTNDRER